MNEEEKQRLEMWRMKNSHPRTEQEEQTAPVGDQSAQQNTDALPMQQEQKPNLNQTLTNYKPNAEPAGIPAPDEMQDDVQEQSAGKVDGERLLQFTNKLLEYKSGKAHLEERVKASENWWRMRNNVEEQPRAEAGYQKRRSKSGWLHNVLTSKHADAMDAYPQGVFLPREKNDKEEAQMLSDIVPYIMQANDYEEVYSNGQWRKIKTGTRVCKVFWDPEKLNGIGDIGLADCSLLNLFWEPGIEDVQKSECFFHTEMWNRNTLQEMYPQVENMKVPETFRASEFETEDRATNEDRVTVIDVYYHVGTVLHYCKYVGDCILESTENFPQQYPNGLYDHGMYPYVFDPLFPVEGSPCGYGYVDLCKPVQQEIDDLRTIMLENAMVNAKPRFFIRDDAGINEKDFADLSKNFVRYSGSLGDDAVKPIEANGMSDNYIDYLTNVVQELREVSGNTETANGVAPAGVTAASALATLAEQSGKRSRDASMSSYRAERKVYNLVLELIRQFYDVPREFRITGKNGAQDTFKPFSNAGLVDQPIGTDSAGNTQYRTPAFDIKIDAEKKSTYTTATQNELMIQLFQLGVFNPANADTSLLLLEGMTFEGKEQIMEKVQQMGTMQQQLALYQQMTIALLAKYEPEKVAGISRDIVGGSATPAQSAQIQAGNEAKAEANKADAASKGITPGANTALTKSKERAREASQPNVNRSVMA